MKRKIVAGNWKSNTSFTEAKELVEKLYRELSHQPVGCRVVIAPPTPFLSGLKSMMNGRIALAAQNSSAYDAGAFTGEYTPAMLSGVGVTYVIAGHSERRQFFGETDLVVAKKVSNILEAGLYVILCVGELLEERDANRQFDVVKTQLQVALFSQVSGEEVANVVIAYEPVWAIGTGRTATPEQAGEMHAYIRALLRETYGAVADDVPVLYGGSVTGSNAAELFAVEDVDGALVGGASLKADEFLQIIDANNA
jgi:triosephosphate isomerase